MCRYLTIILKYDILYCIYSNYVEYIMTLYVHKCSICYFMIFGNTSFIYEI